MEEYFGKKAANYQPMTSGKRYLLFPAIRRHLSSAKDSLLLDIACGKGDLFPIATDCGYRYVGFDSSVELLNIARERFPDARFVEGSAFSIPKELEQQADVVVISMLFPAFGSKDDILRVLCEAHGILKEGGCLLVGVTHPSFDWYMQKGLFDRKDVECVFDGYFESGRGFTIQKGDHEFNDHHWLLADYVALSRKAGFIIEAIDECPPDRDAPSSVQEDRRKFPTYMLIKLTKQGGKNRTPLSVGQGQ